MNFEISAVESQVCESSNFFFLLKYLITLINFISDVIGT